MEYKSIRLAGRYMATLNEIAKIVGVSKATVSNVFTKKKKVSPEVTRRVLEACERLNYYPNRMAASLTTKRMNILGLLLNDEGPVIKKYQKELIGGVLLASSRNGYRILVDMCSLDNNVVYNSLISGSDPMDGTIITAPVTHDADPHHDGKECPLCLVGQAPNGMRRGYSVCGCGQCGSGISHRSASDPCRPQ